MSQAIPVYDVDFYSDAFILDPLPHYRIMRDLGPAVWLPQNQVYALTRFADVTAALRNIKVFSSGRGLSLIPRVNDILVGSTVNSDPPEHDLTRSVTAAPLLPGALREIEPRLAAAAETLVDGLVARGSFDAVGDFATYLPLTIVRELVGLPDAGRDRMMAWASATFDLFGSDNERSKRAFETLKDLRDFLDEYGQPDKLQPGGWARRIFDVGPRKGLSFATCAQIMRDYINPSLDTTISATGYAIHLFAENPDQWDLVRADPSLIPGAIDEATRLATPIRAFSRYVTEDHAIEGHVIPAGSRALIVYAAANRDERRFENPDAFEIRRSRASAHVGFGHGIHMCMGMHLAKLEMVLLVRALAARVSRIESAGTPEIAMNNTIRAFKSLPVRVTR